MTKTSTPPHPGKTSPRHIETVLVHGAAAATGNPGGPTGPTLPPVTFSTAFAYDSAEAMEDAFAGRRDDPIYTRLQNPTVAALERRVRDVSGAAGVVAMASGMSAITQGLLGFLRSGDEIVASPYLFGGSYVLLTQTLPALGITTRFADPADMAAWRAAIGPTTRCLYVEAIANPAMVVPDLAALSALGHEQGIPLLVDATLLTPLLCDADALGVDLAFYSASKYLAGAASTLGGLIVDSGRFPWHTLSGTDLPTFQRAGEQSGEGALLAKLRTRTMAAVGPTLSPMNAFLLLTGMETLRLRLERQCENALTLATFLRGHPKVTRVLYPGLHDHPAHELSSRQFQGRYGTVLSFALTDQAACFRFINALRMIARVTNLGDTRSMVIHPASTIYGSFWAHEREEVGVTEDLIRFSLGIEHAADIIADLEQALVLA